MTVVKVGIDMTIVVSAAIAALPATLGVFVSLWRIHRATKQVDKVSSALDGRLTELISTTRSGALAEGALAEGNMGRMTQRERHGDFRTRKSDTQVD